MTCFKKQHVIGILRSYIHFLTAPAYCFMLGRSEKFIKKGVYKVTRPTEFVVLHQQGLFAPTLPS